MFYQIRKGWPAEAAVDEVLLADDGEEITNGMIVTVADGKCKVANFTGTASDTDPMCAFIFSSEKMHKTFMGIMSQFVIEVDAEGYEADTYAAGDTLTAKDWKFAKAGSSKVLGRVLSFDLASGIMRLMWHEAR